MVARLTRTCSGSQGHGCRAAGQSLSKGALVTLRSSAISHHGLAEVVARMDHALREAGRKPGDAKLIAVSKTFDIPDIIPVIDAGQRIFGENRVQEAKAKFPLLREQFPDIALHIIGPLQTNKVKEAVGLADAIHTLDRARLAAELAREIERQGRHPELFVQVNTGAEPQKAGVLPEETDAFLASCRDEYGLSVAGLMCIPPVDEEPALHFALLDKLARRNGLSGLSMGMSSDFETAIAFGATHIRVGSAIFGHREYPA